MSDIFDIFIACSVDDCSWSPRQWTIIDGIYARNARLGARIWIDATERHVGLAGEGFGRVAMDDLVSGTVTGRAPRDEDLKLLLNMDKVVGYHRREEMAVNVGRNFEVFVICWQLFIFFIAVEHCIERTSGHVCSFSDK